MSLSVSGLEAARALPIKWPDFYFTPEYGRIVEASDEGEWEIAIWEDGAILYPYLKRAIPESDRFDIVSPYGYAGIYAREDQSAEDITAFRNAFREYAAAQGIVSEFLRLSAIANASDDLAKADPSIEIAPHNSTLMIDISAGYDAFFARAEGRARTAVRKARKLGYETSVRHAESDFFEPDSPFRMLYQETMDRIGADPYYSFSDEYFRRFHEELSGRLYAFEVKNAEGVVGSAGLIVAWEPYLHLHLVGSTMEALRDGVGNLFYDAMAAFGCETENLKMLHVGGGQKEGDSLYKFKRSFGGIPIPYALGRCVHDQQAYDALTASRATALGVSGEALRESGYFPSYRGTV